MISVSHVTMRDSSKLLFEDGSVFTLIPFLATYNFYTVFFTSFALSCLQALVGGSLVFAEGILIGHS